MTNPAFQRRHYEAIAKLIRETVELGGPKSDLISVKFADMLAADNPRFDRARFLKACGVAS